MSAIVAYDSVYGNTAEIAKAIAAAIDAKLLLVTTSPRLDLTGVDLLIVGSPTRGFNPTPAIAEFVEGLPSVPQDSVRAAAFDTRLDPDSINPAPLRWVVNAGGYAAQRLSSVLRRKGYAVVEPDAGFAVGGTEGPLLPGELERAAEWAKGLVSKA